jgi:uncharacterized heparinase superfamily protein
VSTAARWLRTLAHVSPAQAWHRGRLTLRRRLWELRPAAIEARYARGAAVHAAFRFDHPGLARVARLREALRPADAALEAARDALGGRFCFLGRALDLGRDVDWYRSDLDEGTRLWKTLLHEFGFAEDLARAWRATGDGVFRERLFELQRSWRSASPIGRRDFALDCWNARAVANRMVNWAVAGSVLDLAPGDPHADWLARELAVHSLFLRDNLELDLRGNHLLRDAVGLVFAQELCGAAPDALALLEREIREQVLGDGCHVERAPMYHAIALRDLLEAALLLGERAPAWLRDAVRRMAGFLEAVRLGDGDLPLFGDGWRGEVAVGPLLDAVRAQIGAPIAPASAASGLVPLAQADARAVLRAGPHGPDYQLGHAHADLLSFELSLGRRRVVTDTGTSLYDAGPERQHLRSTAAHNTVQLDGEELLEAWGSFRTGRCGRARLRARGESGGWRWAWAEHDAWRHLAGSPTHERLLAVREGAALVLDLLRGRGRHRIASRLHLHPERPAERAVQALGAEAVRRAAPLHERFGETRESCQLVVEAEASLPWVGGWWIGEAADLELDARDGCVEVRGGGAALASWRTSARPEDPDAVSLWPPLRGSATQR